MNRRIIFALSAAAILWVAAVNAQDQSGRGGNGGGAGNTNAVSAFNTVGTAPLTLVGAVAGSTLTLTGSVAQATAAADGWLASTNWITFNNKAEITVTNGLATVALMGSYTPITSFDSATNSLTANFANYVPILDAAYVAGITNLVQGANVTITPNGRSWTIAAAAGGGGGDVFTSSNNLFRGSLNMFSNSTTIFYAANTYTNGIAAAPVKVLMGNASPYTYGQVIQTYEISDNNCSLYLQNTYNSHNVKLSCALLSAPYGFSIGNNQADAIVLSASDGVGGATHSVSIGGNGYFTKIGPNGTSITNILGVGTVTNFGVIAAGGSAEVAYPLTGARAGDRVALGIPHAAPAGLSWSRSCVTNNTAIWKCDNFTAVEITNAAQLSYTMDVIGH